MHEIGGGLLLAEDIDEAAHDKQHARSGGAIAHRSQEAQHHQQLVVSIRELEQLNEGYLWHGSFACSLC